MMNHKKWMIWTERDGTRTPIPQLRTSHLEFIIAKIKQSIPLVNGKLWRGNYLPYLQEELSYRKRLDSNQKTT